MKRVHILILILCVAAFSGLSPGVSAQILGYPLAGTTDYPDASGRWIDRYICQDDSVFRVLVADPDNHSLYLSSAGMNIPDVIRFDLISYRKTGSLTLDAGLPAIQTGVKNDADQTVWYAAGGTLLVLDLNTFSFERMIPTDADSIRCLLSTPESGRLLALAQGETDAILDIDTASGTVVTHPLQGLSRQVRTGVLSSDGNSLYVLVNTFPSQVLAIDLETGTVTDSVTVQGAFQATLLCVNPIQDELYVAMPGTPAEIKRFTLPDLQADGSVSLMSDERPSGFMMCSDDGYYMFVCDGDNSGGIVCIDLVLFQRHDRVALGPDGGYPRCADAADGSLWVGTENRPGALFTVSLTPFQLTQTHLFDESAGSAGPVLVDPEGSSVYFSVLNQDTVRLIGLNTDDLNRIALINLPGVEGMLLHGCGPSQDSVCWWIEDGEPLHAISVDLDGTTLLQRRAITGFEDCLDFEYSSRLDRLFVLSTDRLAALDPDTLEISDFVDLPVELVPATSMTLHDAGMHIMVGGAVNSDNVFLYSSDTLEPDGTIPLDPMERQALRLMCLEDRNIVLMIVRDTALKLKRYDLANSQFTGTLDLSIFTNELGGMYKAPAQGRILIHAVTAPERLYRLNLDTFTLETPLDLPMGESIVSGNGSSGVPYSFFSLAGASASLMRYGSSQAHTIKGSWAHLMNRSMITTMHFFAHTTGGSARFAVYSDALVRLWQSPEVSIDVADAWVSVDIDEGEPGVLTLDPGTYLLGWQLSEDRPVPGVTFSLPDSGFRTPWPFSMFPDYFPAGDATEAVWSMYADCVIQSPTPTPTSTGSPYPTSTPSPTPTVPPTYTPHPTHTFPATASPTGCATSTPTANPASTSTPRPGSGVEIRLSEKVFYPGDPMVMTVLAANTDPVPRDVEMFVILDVYGLFWFGPNWTDTVDSYRLPGLLGTRDIKIFDFVWPQVEASAQGLRFWGGMVSPGIEGVFGYYDMVEFGYDYDPPTETPQPTPTPSGGGTVTPTETPVETPFPTETPSAGNLVVEFPGDDPMSYAGEGCGSHDVFCFPPERLLFCSDWYGTMRLRNTGGVAVEVSIWIAGPDSGDFESEFSLINVGPGETKSVRLRFCPSSPPDTLKRAVVTLVWATGQIDQSLKGWSVAG